MNPVNIYKTTRGKINPVYIYKTILRMTPIRQEAFHIAFYHFIAFEAILPVLDFTIFVYGSSCKRLFSASFSLHCLFVLFIGIPKGRMGCREIGRERKKERKRPKQIEFHELPRKEMVKSGTVRPAFAIL